MAVKIINRANADALIPEPISREIINGVRKDSVFMNMARRLPNMSTLTQRQPVLSMLPQADFVNGDAGMKTTTNLAWDKKIMVAGEIAAIIPIPQAVLDDASYDIWGQAMPPLVEAFGRTIDLATISVRNPKAPTEWPDPLIPQAIAAGNVEAAGTGVDIAEDISNLFGILEEDEYDVNGLIAHRKLKTQLRNLRDANNNPIYTPLTGVNPATIYGVPTNFAGKGIWTAAAGNPIMLAGDWTNAVYSIRQDLTFQIFDTGVISDDDGTIVYNLMQQDMVALRAVMRLAWQVANPIDIDRQDEATTYFPFAVLTDAPTGGGGNG